MSDSDRRARRERLVGLLLLGVGVVLLVSTPTWFLRGQVGVGLAQLALGAVLLATGGWLVRRSAGSG